MTPNELRNEIQRFIASAWDVGLARDSNISVSQAIGGRRYLVSWKNAEPLLIEGHYETSWRQYSRWIRNRQYSLLLADYSFLQISYVLKRGEIVKHRLVYYPCPVEIDPELAGELGIADYFELLRDSELLSRVRLEVPLRFEFDPDSAGSGHPASHLHLSRDCCRIPVYAPLSLGRFVRFIFCHFYPQEYATHQFLRAWPCASVNRCIRASERAELHFACS